MRCIFLNILQQPNTVHCYRMLWSPNELEARKSVSMNCLLSNNNISDDSDELLIKTIWWRVYISCGSTSSGGSLNSSHVSSSAVGCDGAPIILRSGCPCPWSASFFDNVKVNDNNNGFFILTIRWYIYRSCYRVHSSGPKIMLSSNQVSSSTIGYDWVPTSLRCCCLCPWAASFRMMIVMTVNYIWQLKIMWWEWCQFWNNNNASIPSEEVYMNPGILQVISRYWTAARYSPELSDVMEFHVASGAVVFVHELPPFRM